MLNWGSALCLAAGLAASQLLLGGWWYPALAAPGYLLVAVGAVAAGFAFLGVRDAPGAWCVGSTLLFGLYLGWRQSVAPDPYAARADTWLMLGFLCVYFSAAWQLRSGGPRALILSVVFLLVVGQSLIAIAQFASVDGLQTLGDTSWGETFASGAALLSTAGTGGNGSIQAGALEGSNVDVTQQLVNMITAQRNFQANAKMISTSDSLSQTIINIR